MPEGLPERDSVAEAVVDLMIERGYEGMSVDLVVARAGIDRAEFDWRYDGLEDCVLKVYWWYTDAFTEAVVASYEGEDSWRDGFRAAAYAAARWIRDNPRIVNFGTVQMFGAGLMAQAQRTSHLQRMVDLIDAGRQELDDPDSVGRGVAEGVFGSIYEFTVREVRAGNGPKSALDFVPELMYIAVRPYLGAAAAREELKIPAPPERKPSRTGSETGDARV
jgi:AcrR family transcriptional regulator